MARSLVKRVLEAMAVPCAALTLAFVLVRLSGDPTHRILPPDATEAARMDLRRSLGLDRPVAAPFVDFVANARRGDFGKSYFADRSVKAIIMDHLPQTAWLAGTAVLLGVLVALPLGAISAIRRGAAIDRLSQSFSRNHQSGNRPVRLLHPSPDQVWQVRWAASDLRCVTCGRSFTG